jgi:hypothetical protein
MRVLQTEVFTFDELNKKAQNEALIKLYDFNVDQDFWSESTIDDAKTVAALMGIDIENIFFSGFHSQGDGACFEGYYAYKPNSLKNIQEFAPLDTDLHQIARDLQNIQRNNFYQLYAKVKPKGRYYHEFCTEISVCSHKTGDEVGGQAESSLSETLRDFMRWTYKQLQAQYDYLTSDEAIKEAIVANDMEFLESGELV